MSAKPRATVRLAPSILHALAYLAERKGVAPAEMAREMIGAAVEAQLTGNGWRRDWEATYRAWLAEQGNRPGRAESPEQRDYDQLADGHMSPASPALRTAQRALTRPLGDTIAADAATIARVVAARATRERRL